jgi:glycerol-3-phosphate dehydrogenase
VRENDLYDVVVVGGGVLGTATASRLASTTARVALVEAGGDIAAGASKGNAGIITAYYAPKGTPEAQLLLDSLFRWDDICERLDVPFWRCGVLTVALDDEQEAALEPLAAKQRELGLEPAILTGGQAREFEPLLSPSTQAALFLPEEGIIDPFRLTWGYAELAAANGADLRFDAPVVGVTHEDGATMTVRTTRSALRTRYLVNAAGLGSHAISVLAGGESFHDWPRKGQYWILDRSFGSQLRTVVVPVPGTITRGVQVVPTTNGSALLGPDASDHEDPLDVGVDAEALAELVARTCELIPSITTDLAIKTYAANRPASDEPVRVRADAKLPHLVHAFNRSTGVSASPATAERVLMLLREAGLECPDRPDAADRLPAIPRLLFADDPERLGDLDSRYRQVVCACEQVTAAELSAAVDARIPARSIEGVRMRTRATGGRCQGAYCLAGVTLACALASGAAPAAVGQGPLGGAIGPLDV